MIIKNHRTYARNKFRSETKIIFVFNNLKKLIGAIPESRFPNEISVNKITYFQQCKTRKMLENQENTNL